MWGFTILTLILFDISHSYPRTDRHRDVYEIQEDKPSHTVRFVNPRGDSPVVREITYYHLVETPYDAAIGGHKQIDSSSSSEEATERPATNGHGFPLLDLLPDDADDETISETSKEMEDNESNDEIVSADDFITADEVKKTPEVDQNQPTSDESTKDKSGKRDDEVPADEENIEDIILAVIEEDKNNAAAQSIDPMVIVKEESKGETPVKPIIDVLPHEVKESGKDEDKVEVPIVTEISKVSADEKNTNIQSLLPAVTEGSLVSSTESTEAKKIRFRNRILFGSPMKLRNRYLNMKKLLPFIKEKIPEGADIPANGSVETVQLRRKRQAIEDIPEAPILPPLNFDSLPEDVKDKFKFPVLPKGPKMLEELYETQADEISGRALPNAEEDTNEDEPNKYHEEMKHKMDDMFSNIKPDDEESKDVDPDADGIVNVETKNVRTYGMSLTGDRGYVFNNMWSNPGLSYNVGSLETVPENSGVEESKPENPIIDIDGQANPEELIDVSEEAKPPVSEGTKPEGEIEVTASAEEEDLDDIFVHNSEPITKTTTVAPEVEKEIKTKDGDDEADSKVADILEEFLNNKEFWQWLTDWTEMYTTTLKNYIHKVVDKQIEKLEERLKSEKAEQEVKEKSDEDIEKEIPTNVVVNKSIFVDGKQISLTTSSNLNTDAMDISDLLKSRKHKDKKKDEHPTTTIKPETELKPITKDEIKVNAENIYGNTVGSEKVTNMFFFFTGSKEEAAEKIDSLINNKENITESETNKDIENSEPVMTTTVETTTIPQSTTTDIPKTEAPIIDERKEEVTTTTELPVASTELNTAEEKTTVSLPNLQEKEATTTTVESISVEENEKQKPEVTTELASTTASEDSKSPEMNSEIKTEIDSSSTNDPKEIVESVKVNEPAVEMSPTESSTEPAVK